MKKALWLLEAGLFIIFSMPLAILPFKVSIKAGEMLGLLLFYIWGSRRRIAIENIKLLALGSQLSAVNIAKRLSETSAGRSLR